MKTESSIFQSGKEQPWEPMAKGVSRQLMGYNDQLMTVKVKFETGCSVPSHSHPHSQTSYIVSGKFEFTNGDETSIVEAGDGVYLRPHVPHACKCLEGGMVVDSFSPVREDFLK